LELPARDGGWSEWTDWTCSVTCGGGVGVQTRTCTNPTPNVYGDMCNGSDTMKGKCNTFPCGEISPDTEEIIKHRLQTQYFSKEVDEGDIVKLECDRVTLAIVKRESPKSRVGWLKDGNYLKQISKRIRLTKESVDVQKKGESWRNVPGKDIVGESLFANTLPGKLEGFHDDDMSGLLSCTQWDRCNVINNSTPSDSGVYLCVLYRVMGLKSTLRVVTLAVKPRWYTRANRETRAQTLWCNSLTLGYVYDDLSQRWEHNGIVWKDYGITTPAATAEDRKIEVRISL
ncbi:unnamed protein product, partial [Timema podura]|nr:unnamed protein product [Timema podura]